MSWGTPNHTLLPTDMISITDPGRPDDTIDGDEVRANVATLDISPQEGNGAMPTILIQVGNSSDPDSALMVGAVRIGGLNVDKATIMLLNDQGNWEILAWNNDIIGDFEFEPPARIYLIRIFVAGTPTDNAPVFENVFVDLYACWYGKE